ncbi:hypothetical protein HF086_004686 [Spodoptera exigua]|uniref:Uncharacterized protein n=1 Tax=Spodoptera exigua TaxID=7107 RepID=A0A922M785_SPOEX|nr:hypothetical protein HF086_004686 [Spodoptera exigua]
MRYNRLVLIFLLLLTVVCVKSDLNKDGRVVLVSPVLAPYRNARAETNETAKDFPVLMLLAGDEDKNLHDERNKDIVEQPVYVKVSFKINMVKFTIDCDKFV